MKDIQYIDKFTDEQISSFIVENFLIDNLKGCYYVNIDNAYVGFIPRPFEYILFQTKNKDGKLVHFGFTDFKVYYIDKDLNEHELYKYNKKWNRFCYDTLKRIDENLAKQYKQDYNNEIFNIEKN